MSINRYKELVYKKKKGRPFCKENNTDRFDPTTEIVKKFIEIKGYTDKWQKYWDLRKTIISHLKSVQDHIINNTDGVYLPNNLGKFQIMNYSTNKAINWPETKKLRDKRGHFKSKPEDFVYYDNLHSNGMTAKIFYRKHYNVTKGIKLGYYKNKDLWGFSAARLFGDKMSLRIKDGTAPYYHTLTKEYISNRKRYYQYRNIILDNPEQQW